ncbi:hypothetical protein KEM52_000310 [Ascosphaera acerosa]|nr:hypothetical protein KEM52_000310 [Ascosphaera acerosa]
MALRESTLRLPRLLARPPCAVSLNNITATTSKPAAAAAATPRLRGYATTTTTTGAAAPDVAELEAESGFANGSVPDAAAAAQFDPVGKARQRKTQLPPSRYQFRPPKYYRGPLHPHRPPPDWDPASRRFVPGPFTLPRVEQTYDASIEADYMTLCYMHTPPGFTPAAVPDRLRAWDDSSPYHANRPRRAPRGGNVLRLLRRPVTFNAVPRLTRITVNTYAKAGGTGAVTLIFVVEEGRWWCVLGGPSVARLHCGAAAFPTAVALRWRRPPRPESRWPCVAVPYSRALAVAVAVAVTVGFSVSPHFSAPRHTVRIGLAARSVTAAHIEREAR